MAEETEELEVSPRLFSGQGVRTYSADSRIALITPVGGFTLEDRVLEKECLFAYVEETLAEIEEEYGQGSLKDLRIELFPAANKPVGVYEPNTEIAKIFISNYASEHESEGTLSLLSHLIMPQEEVSRFSALSVRKNLGRLKGMASWRYNRLVNSARETWVTQYEELYFPIMRTVVRHEAAHHLHLSGKLKINEVPDVMDEREFIDVFSIRVLGEGFATLVARDYQQLLPFSQGRFLRGIVQRLYEAAATPAPYLDIMAAAGEEILSGSKGLYHAAGEYIGCTILEAYGIDTFKELFTTQDRDEILLRHAEACELLGRKVQPLM